jgi:nitrogen regulatory protein PII
VTRSGLTPMTKVEVVVRGDDVPDVEQVLTTCGATGYTVLSGVSGLGHHGFHQGRLHFNDRDALRMVLTVVDDDRAGSLISALRALLDDRPGVLFVSDTFVSRPDHFR